MPITQARMQSIVSAGLNYVNAHAKATKGIRDAWQAVRQGANPFDVLEILYIEWGQNEMAGVEDVRSLARLETEAAWFARFAKVNDRNRRKLQRRKGARVDGVDASANGENVHPSTRARIRLAESEAELRELQEREDAELDAQAAALRGQGAGSGHGSPPKSFPTVERCEACNHPKNIHDEINGCLMCGCKAHVKENSNTTTTENGELK